MYRLAPIILLAACASAPANRYGALHREITTGSDIAQARFDEGLLLCYAFNHDEAVRRFDEALAADANCAMAHFGIAYALGPNINMPAIDAKAAQRGHEAAQRALQLADRCTPVERALIEAMSKRFASPPPENRRALDEAWAQAMRKVHTEFPNDSDVGAIFVESVLDLSPWDYWTPELQAKPGIGEALTVLESILARDPNHQMAIHLYIHATEAGPNPEKALEPARRLAALAPACGHLVHMPAHTYHRLGLYEDAVQANLDGTRLDRDYFAGAGPQGIYHFYMAHNQHFATWSAMYMGDSATAIRMARELVRDLPQHHLTGLPAFCDGFLVMPMHVLIRFGRWDEVLSEPQAGPTFPISRALHHYGRGIAHANLGDVAKAKLEQENLLAALQYVPAEATIGLTPAKGIMDVAKAMLAGEILYREGRNDDAFAKLREAVAAEDRLRYDEPSGWMQPARHALGALLLEQGLVDEALEVYREDARRHPQNGWTLHGLAECLRRKGDPQAATVEAAFQTAFRSADVQIKGSCFCRTK